MKADYKVPNEGYGSAAEFPIAPWTDLLRTAIKDLAELLDFVELSHSELDEAPMLDSAFPLLVPRGFAARMRKRDPHDPLLRQVLPLARERDAVPGFDRDPLDEIRRSQSGVIRKYAGRALLVTTAACPIHCRYCFRRHFPYADQSASRASWTDAIAALERARDVSEVILSGGDPLTLANGRLKTLIDKLERLDHLRTLRIHTRFPIVLPERIDAELRSILAASRLRTVVVVHCNNAQEIDASVERALAALHADGAMLLNQSVLLRGINDDAATLRALSERLLDAHVLPYYLHALDPVAGSAHFDVPEREALALAEEMRNALPGYLVPRLVRELPGELSKTMLT